MKFGKKILTLLLALTLCCASLAVALAEEGAEQQIYMLGDVMEDFTVTLSDGTSVTLSELLQTKQAVLINFWATWCGPCGMEFPYMQEAYLKYQDQVAIVALSIEPTDTAEVIEQYKAENGLESLPMGSDAIGLADFFAFDGIPTSVMVDRFGVICFQESGSITSTDKFERLFDGFVGDDYTESKVGYTIPAAKPTVDAISAEELSAALNVEGGELVFTNDEDEYAWPFLATEDGKLISSNTGVDESTAVVNTTITAAAGDALAFDYTVSTEAAMDMLLVSVNGEVVAAFSGANAGTYAYGFAEDGTYTVSFSYRKDMAAADLDDCVTLDNVRLATDEEATALLDAQPKEVKVLADTEYELTPADETAREIVFLDATGVIDELLAGTPCYVVPGDVGNFQVLLGENLVPGLCLAYGDGDYIYQSVADMEQSGDGYVFQTALSAVEMGGYSNTYVYFYPNILNTDEATVLFVFANEENVNYFCQVELPAYYGIEGVTWMYADGSQPSTQEVAQEPEQTSLPDGYAQYTIRFVDQDGAAVAGAMAQICDAGTCEVFPADEDGVVSCIKPVYPYEIHVLKVPDGYTFDTTQTFTMDENGDELTITLTKE